MALINLCKLNVGQGEFGDVILIKKMALINLCKIKSGTALDIKIYS